MSMDDILIFGIGAKGDEVAAFIKEYDLYNIIGFTVDAKYLNVEHFWGLPVYPAEVVEKYINTDTLVYIAVSQQLFMNRIREEKYNMMKEKGYHFANIVSPKATVKACQLGEGNWVKDFAYIGYKSEVEDNNIFGVYSNLEHYSVIGNHNYVCCNSTIAGNCRIGNNNYFGVSSTVYNVVNIGNKCLIGGGAIVKKDIFDYTLCKSVDSNIEQINENLIECYILPKEVMENNE